MATKRKAVAIQHVAPEPPNAIGAALEVGWFPVTLDPAAADDALLGECSASLTALR